MRDRYSFFFCIALWRPFSTENYLNLYGGLTLEKGCKMAVTEQSVTASMEKLVGAINQLTELVKTAAEEMHEEPNKALEDKLDQIIQQNNDLLKHNEDISSSLLLLLELSRQQSAQAKKVFVPQPAPLPLRREEEPSEFGAPDLGMPPELPRI
jgi:hypothetical protein